MAAFENFWEILPALEVTYHPGIHLAIGGDMMSMRSTADPLLWLHHAYLDHVFDLWQDCHDHEKVHPSYLNERHYWPLGDGPGEMDGYLPGYEGLTPRNTFHAFSLGYQYHGMPQDESVAEICNWRTSVTSPTFLKMLKHESHSADKGTATSKISKHQMDRHLQHIKRVQDQASSLLSTFTMSLSEPLTVPDTKYDLSTFDALNAQTTKETVIGDVEQWYQQLAETKYQVEREHNATARIALLESSLYVCKSRNKDVDIPRTWALMNNLQEFIHEGFGRGFCADIAKMKGMAIADIAGDSVPPTSLSP
jgi:hypothetical protein